MSLICLLPRSSPNLSTLSTLSTRFQLSKPSKKSVERGTRKTAQGSASEWIKQGAPVSRKRNSSTKKHA